MSHKLMWYFKITIHTVCYQDIIKSLFAKEREIMKCKIGKQNLGCRVYVKYTSDFKHFSDLT